MKSIANIYITPSQIRLNGQPLSLQPTLNEMPNLTGKAMLISCYRQRVDDYPKFYKMDPLARLGFIASELLLKSLDEKLFCERDDRAIILVNSSASFVADCRYEKTIHEPSNYFPSPADFVYTLPNIVTGEIAIRHHYHAETSFLVVERRDAVSPHGSNVLEMLVEQAFCDPKVTSVLGGWLECYNENDFLADLSIFVN